MGDVPAEAPKPADATPAATAESPAGKEAIEKATLNNAQAAENPDAPPGAKECCPRKLILGVFFDGTGNNEGRDRAKKSESNVARLHKAYKDNDDDKAIREKLYIPGVGTGMSGSSGDQLVSQQQSSQDTGAANRLVRDERS